MYKILKEDSFSDDLKNVKDDKSRENIKNKVLEIANILENNPAHFKNLRKPLQKYKRAHVNKCYVIIFSVDSFKKTVTFYYYRHHDDVYNI